MKLNIELRDNSCGSEVAMLNSLLADEFVLGINTRNYHWNATGRHCHDLDELFASQYDAFDEIMNDVAERTRALGGRAAGTPTEFFELAHLKEQPGEWPITPQTTVELLASHEAVIRQIRADAIAYPENLGHAGTANFLTGLLERHEKMTWMLRAVLKEGNQGPAGKITTDLDQRK